MKRYTQATEGQMFDGDGISLSWPYGGEREVVELDENKLPRRVKLRVANGTIVETDLEATQAAQEVTPWRLLEGEETRQVFEEPAAPVTRIIHNRHTGEATEVIVPDPVTKPASEVENFETPPAEEEAEAVEAEAEAAQPDAKPEPEPSSPARAPRKPAASRRKAK